MIHIMPYAEKFAQKILDGTKTCTIRNPQQWVHLQVGDTIELFAYTQNGYRCKKVIKSIDKIVIDFNSDLTYYADLRDGDDVYLCLWKSDGFDSAEQFYDYFRTKATDNGIYKALLISW